MKVADVNNPAVTSLGGGNVTIGGTTPDGSDEWVSDPISTPTTMWVPVMTEDVGTGIWYVVTDGDGNAVMTEVPI